VLQTLVDRRARLCDADKGTITRQIEGVFYRAESYGFSAEVMERWEKRAVNARARECAGRALLEVVLFTSPIRGADPDYTFDTAGAVMRSMLGVPMAARRRSDRRARPGPLRGAPVHRQAD